MSLQTVPVTCTAIDQNGNPMAGGRFRFVLTGTDIDQGLVAPESVEEQADENGVLVINLWPNQLGVNGTSYRVRCWNPDTNRKYLDATCVVPNAPCRLEQIIQMEPYPAVDAAQQALAGAQAALAAATAKSDQAATSAVSAAGSATAAAGSTLASANSATLSGERAIAAATSASQAASSAVGSAASAVQAQQFASLAQATNPDSPIRLNPKSITTNLTIPPGYNAASVGPIAISDGITVTVSDYTTWSIH